jgi:hypothetical protein
MLVHGYVVFNAYGIPCHELCQTVLAVQNTVSIFCFGGNIYSKKKFLLWCFFFNKFCVHVAALLLSQNIHWSLNNWCSLGNFLSNFKILMFSPLLLEICILYMFFLLSSNKKALYNFDDNLIRICHRSCF